MHDPVEEIKGRLDIMEVVAPYVELKRAGRNFKGLCPFHKEKSASFMVSQEKQLAYCFSCRKGGDIFSFIQEVEGIEFQDALTLLAEKAKVEIKGTSRLPKGKKQRLLKLLEVAQEYFSKNLQKGNPGAEYFDERKITKEDIANFQLGFAPKESKGLVSYLIDHGFSKHEMGDSGVVSMKDVNRDIVYDRFQDRVMYALHNAQGNVVGFAGRIIGEGEPKYLNTPETELYHKGQLLYGWHLAKDAIRKEDKVIVVEGYMDVIACHRAGLHHVVGVSGTALTEEQIKLMKRFTKNVYLCFDRDQAGVDATVRSFVLAAKEDMACRWVQIPGGKDPDEVLSEDPHGLTDALDTAKPFLEVYLELIKGLRKEISPQSNRLLAERFFRVVMHVGSAMEQEWYLKKLRDVVGADLRVVFQDFKRFRAGIKNPKPIHVQQQPVKQRSKELTQDEIVLGLLLHFPEMILDVNEFLQVGDFSHDKAKNLYILLRDQYTELRSPDTVQVTQYDKRSLQEYASVLQLFIDEYCQSLSKNERQDLLIKEAKRLENNALHKRVSELHMLLREAHGQGDKDRQNQVTLELNELLPRLRSSK